MKSSLPPSFPLLTDYSPTAFTFPLVALSASPLLSRLTNKVDTRRLRTRPSVRVGKVKMNLEGGLF